jgi:flagellar biosynthesis/type III secretory pathway chaperone
MNKLLPAFTDTTARINQILDTLVQVGQAKQQLIISGRVQELDKLIQKEGITVSNLEKLEGARFKLQEEIASRWRIAPEKINVAVILEKLQEEHYDSYGTFKDEIERLSYNLDRLRVINSNNNDLINQSLNYIDEIQSVLYGDVAGTYSEKGLQSEEDPLRPHISILDKKA